MKKIVYVDMDGVVADFGLAIKTLSLEKINEDISSIEDDILRGELIDRFCEEHNYIFSIVPPIEGAIEAVTKLQKKYDVYFLSTPMWGVPQSFTDKRLWIDKYFGISSEKRLILTHRKDLNIGEYLIDDRLKNGAGEFKGEHIHFGTEKYPNWDSVLNYLLAQ